MRKTMPCAQSVVAQNGNHEDLQLAAFVEGRRFQLKMSCEQASKLAGLELSQWFALESGWVPPCVNNIGHALARTLQIELQEITLLADASRRHANSPERMLSRIYAAGDEAEYFSAYIHWRHVQLGMSCADAAKLAGLELSEWIALEAAWIPEYGNNILWALAGTLEIGIDISQTWLKSAAGHAIFRPPLSRVRSRAAVTNIINQPRPCNRHLRLPLNLSDEPVAKLAMS